MTPPHTVERAYELARSGECRGVDEIKKRLKAEQCSAVEAQLAGRAIQRELRALCLEATAAREVNRQNG